MILLNIILKISMSVKFKTPIAGNMVRYAKRKIVPPKIRFGVPLNGEAVRKASENKVDTRARLRVASLLSLLHELVL